ncbi:MAG: ATP-dependent DNA helicase RecG [Firmicutes bacterium]|nr:ATP-dependent DNA helicase RecG [Bacillota bacterium]MCM1401324.1 ATP-dependent DNA helicase RecG [Bacteroides sp.]MCM1477277.1 ATP-dependent DNA helicase RecG [Bacteroides sp.]
MSTLREFDIKFLKGVGPARAKLLAEELEIKSLYDLLYHFPSHYVDRSRFYSVNSLRADMPMVQVRGRFITFNMVGEGAKRRLVGLFTDGTGTMECVWFNRIKAISGQLQTGVEYVAFGKPSEFSGRWSMVHPEIETSAKADAGSGLRGIYPLTEKLRNRGITSRTLFSWIQLIIQNWLKEVADPLPPEITARLRLMDKRQALVAIHNPQSDAELQRARERLKFEELFYLQLNILSYSLRRSMKLGGRRFTSIGNYFNTFYSDCLPFELTGAQKRVIKEIRRDMNSGRQMNRLLQGDVGSGKTLVALMCMLIALDNGCQACLMAPTEILATQHYETISSLASKIGVNVKLLTGSTTKRRRDEINTQLLDGSLHILIGTHAVIEDTVQFSNLGFVVIDEQHRFGVAQRAKLWKKNAIPPHVLVMTATPIPRTLAMTLYGDLDVSVIDELPPGRKPVTTLLRYEQNRLEVYRSIARQVKQGRQVYIVYPLIKESEKSDLKSLEEGYENILETFRGFRVAYVHGQMKPAEKDAQMNIFASHRADILVATTVIEVGVNVPNATVMLIENAERFGLSQLHQLRGRVGRGADQSFCILMTKPNIASLTRKRLSIMTSTTDGFVVAEADMKLRGPGDIEGTMQSGLSLNLRIANIATDGRLIQLARDEAQDLLDSDPLLERFEHRPLAVEMHRLFDKTIDWSMIS